MLVPLSYVGSNACVLEIVAYTPCLISFSYGGWLELLLELVDISDVIL